MPMHSTRNSRPGPTRRVLLGGLLGGLAGTLVWPRLARAWTGSVDAATFGLRGDGSFDNAETLQRAVDAMSGTGGTLRLAAGRYRIGRTVLLRSGITLAGPATGTGRAGPGVPAPGATIFSDNRWTPVPVGQKASRFALLSNRNFAAEAITDRDIAVRDLGFAYTGQLRGDAHAVSFRRAQGIVVSGCGFQGGGDATAFLACRNTLVERCTSRETVNCAYDHWEGSSDGVVRDSYAHCKLGYGILFTGQGTSNDDHQTASRLTASGNTIENSGTSAIWVCSLSERSVVSDVVLTGNTILAGEARNSGIGASGDVRRIRMQGNTIRGIRGGNALFTRSDKWHRPNGIEMLGNRMEDCVTDNRNVALIQALGDNITVSGTRATGGSYRSLVWVDGTGVRLADNRGDGLTSQFKYNAAVARGPQIADP